ncbi:MAG: cell division protein FtsQ/DivIB [Pseudomonadota bacterium]
MRPLKRDPAPSRIAFRAKRLWRSPRFRRVATVYAPLGLLSAGLTWAAFQADWRDLAMAKMEETRANVAAMEEFAIKRIDVSGATAEVEGHVRAVLFDIVGSSSMHADAALIRARVEELGWVETARVRLAPPETLMISVRERTPRAVWRNDGRLMLVDGDGAAITPLNERGERADLPLIAGDGADRAVAEAEAILEEAGALAEAVRGLVRVGERRWDMVFADGPRVMLPAEGPVDAVAYLVIMQGREDVLGRDLAAVDLRLMKRPTLRLSPDAKEALDAARAPKKPGEDA